MTRARQQRLVSLLMRDDGWVTAATLADLLGVTPRSVRNYIAQINGRSANGDAIESGPAGYRVNRAAARTLEEPPAERDRLPVLARALIDRDDGIDVFEVAEQMHVSDSTVEADLTRVRALLTGTGLRLERDGSRVRLHGDEIAQRRLLSRLVHDEMGHGRFDLAALREATRPDGFGGAIAAFTGDLVAELAELGYYVNEIAAADAALHVAIAAERVALGRGLDEAVGGGDPRDPRLVEAVGRLAAVRFGVELGEGDLRHLVSLLLNRVAVPGGTDEAPLDPRIAEAVRAAVAHAAREYMVDIVDADFVRRLALHVQNLAHRARQRAFSRNPMTRSLKTSYPMIFEVAVSIASELAELLDVEVPDDEIGYIAMHVGGLLERSRSEDAPLTATIVCPGYYELHELLRSRVGAALGPAIEVTDVITRVDVDWAKIDTDLVLTTIDPPSPDERTVHVPPFLGDADVARIGLAASRLRRQRRLARLRAELRRYVSPDAFVRPLPADADEVAVIRLLGAPLVAAGVIDEEYLAQTVERERMSSTAFTEALAVPHALQMTAARTAISVGIADGSIPWGDGRVQVVVLAAFSEAEREAFQTVFEQLVEVFGERESVQRIVRRGTDFAAFLDELAAVIDG